MNHKWIDGGLDKEWMVYSEFSYSSTAKDVTVIRACDTATVFCMSKTTQLKVFIVRVHPNSSLKLFFVELGIVVPSHQQ